jgi:hypothetical protein
MREAWGHGVDNRHLRSLPVVGLSVDRRAHIVRNPHEGGVESATVDNRGKTRGAYSHAHLLLAQAFERASHNAPVLTGTTTGIEFLLRY